jgi:hypothetical protein
VAPSVFTATSLVVVVAGVSCWVLMDARKRLHRGRPVVAVLLGFTIGEPATWAVLCLFLSVFFIPLYLVARSSSD